MGVKKKDTEVRMAPQRIFETKLMKLTELRLHERINLDYLKEFKKRIESDGILKRAIAVDRNTNIILDGTHRFYALKELGCKKIPATLFDYRLPEIQVRSWRKGIKVTKDDVIEAGLGKKKKLPPHTSKHIIKVGSTSKHISAVEKKVNIPLESLR
jgi:ParB-like chromosome segregation protein Spo0J